MYMWYVCVYIYIIYKERKTRGVTGEGEQDELVKWTMRVEKRLT